MIDNKKNISSADNDCLMYRPFQSKSENVTTEYNIHIKRDHYSTSLDPRGYIPVYEYIINNTPIMWDRETGYVHFTGIWKALGNSKSDIVKMVDSNPELGTKKIRGGFLRIQGTWIPYDYAHILCKRTAWNIRKELIPIFGQGFPSEALSPDHPDYGCLLLDPKSYLPANGRKNNTNSGSQHHKRNTMRQNHNNKPYCKRTTTKKLPRTPKPMKSCSSSYISKKKSKQLQQEKEKEQLLQQRKIAASMSVNRLLNEDSDSDSSDEDILSSEEEFDDDEDDMMTDDNGSSSSSSSSLSSSPSFRVVQTYPPEEWLNSVPLLPPIYNSFTATTPSPPPTSYHSPTVSLSPCSPVTPTHIAQDIIDTISATILLQRLSQDDGARPFKPLESSVIPSKVIVGHQEFTICWD